MLKIETTTRAINSMPFLVFQRDHLRSNLGMIPGLGIICGRGSFAALYKTLHKTAKHLRCLKCEGDIGRKAMLIKRRQNSLQVCPSLKSVVIKESNLVPRERKIKKNNLVLYFVLVISAVGISVPSIFCIPFPWLGGGAGKAWHQLVTCPLYTLKSWV